MDLCEFEAILVYTVSYRTAKATKRNPVLKKQQKLFASQFDFFKGGKKSTSLLNLYSIIKMHTKDKKPGQGVRPQPRLPVTS